MLFIKLRNFGMIHIQLQNMITYIYTYYGIRSLIEFVPSLYLKEHLILQKLILCFSEIWQSKEIRTVLTLQKSNGWMRLLVMFLQVLWGQKKEHDDSSSSKNDVKHCPFHEFNKLQNRAVDAFQKLNRWVIVALELSQSLGYQRFVKFLATTDLLVK